MNRLKASVEHKWKNAGADEAARNPSEKKTVAQVDQAPLPVFTADLLDVSLKDDLASMEHPLFALRAGDTRIRTYERAGVKVTVKPGPDGCATIHDKDLWIYCVSQLVEAMNRGRSDVNRVVRFKAYDFLVSTGRQTGGTAYKRIGAMFERLSGTRIETNIETDSQRERNWFGLIDYARVIERDGSSRMVAVEVALPEWLWRSVRSKNVLTLNPGYFNIRKAIDRRIYELVRKHCGNQNVWQISVKALHEKSGSSSVLRNFRCDVKALVEAQTLPDYQVLFDEASDLVSFVLRSAEKTRRSRKKLGGAKNNVE